MGCSPPNDIDAEIRRLIRHKVRRLVGRCGLTIADRQDLEQELALHAISKQSFFDPARGTSKAFHEKLLRRKAASILRSRGAAKREHGRVGVEAEVEKLPAREEPDLAMQIDLRRALDAMPVELSAVATLFMNCREAEVIRRIGLGRQRVRAMKQRIAQHLRALGLSEKTRSAANQLAPRRRR